MKPAEAPFAALDPRAPGAPEPAPVPAPRARRPYSPPRITFREPLEGVAALCGVTGKGDPVMCPTGPIAS